jgi:hypothetical protein
MVDKTLIYTFCRHSEQLPGELTHGDMREPPRHTLHPALHRLPPHQRSLQLQDSGGDPRWVPVPSFFVFCEQVADADPRGISIKLICWIWI